MISDYHPDMAGKENLSRHFYLNAKSHQLAFFPRHYFRGLVNQADHLIAILSEADMHTLEGVDPKSIMIRGQALKKYREWRDKKEDEGKFSWTLALYGTAAMAKEAGLSEKEYWNQIIRSCFLDKPSPIADWRKTYQKIDRYLQKLDRLAIEKVKIEGADVNLSILIGDKRRWRAGGGANIPSFEIFTSPDWRGTEGWIRFNQPLYHYGHLVQGIELEFKNGLVVKSRAKKNERLLKEMIAVKNADKVGEFSLTDKRFSRIDKFMAETLFDENFGGSYGNTHIALGDSYHECFDGKQKGVAKPAWLKMGFNDSSVHTDIISTTNRTVTAYLKSGRKKVIYKNGIFTL